MYDTHNGMFPTGAMTDEDFERLQAHALEDKKVRAEAKTIGQELFKQMCKTASVPIRLGFKKIHPDAVLPSYAHEGDAGMDIYAIEDVILYPFTPTLVKSGLVAEIPMGYELQVRPRSGLALKQGITVWNSPGTIDCGYKGEIGVILLWAPHGRSRSIEGRFYSLLQIDFGEPAEKMIWKGDRIAQLVLAPVTRAEVVEITKVSETERGTGGFGSTGV
jgi:dUTP pyrophosphatase